MQFAETINEINLSGTEHFNKWVVNNSLCSLCSFGSPTWKEFGAFNKTSLHSRFLNWPWRSWCLHQQLLLHGCPSRLNRGCQSWMVLSTLYFRIQGSMMLNTYSHPSLCDLFSLCYCLAPSQGISLRCCYCPDVLKYLFSIWGCLVSIATALLWQGA